MAEQAELKDFGEIDIARNELGKPTRKVATIPGEVGKANQRGLLGPDPWKVMS
jgi:hypothetical protein